MVDLLELLGVDLALPLSRGSPLIVLQRWPDVPPSPATAELLYFRVFVLRHKLVISACGLVYSKA